MNVNCVMKVADFGLAVNMGSNQYFRQNKEDMVRLPIKWLAPECMEDNKFSEKSDVVSLFTEIILELCVSKHTFIIKIMMKIAFCIQFTVGIWCNMLGDLHWWKYTLLWD